MKLRPHLLASAAATAMMIALAPRLSAAESIVVADFEGFDYGVWKTTGNAFGKGPAQGTLPGQMKVEGFQGKGLVNSFNGGDDSTGQLTSPAIKIERKFVTFLIGGGGFSNETCMNLVVDGKIVRRATGPNVNPGGTEKLSPAAWDVTEFAGRDAVIEIVDERKGGWGHINVDYIVLADDRGDIPLAAIPEQPAPERARTFQITADFLQLPLMHREDARKPGLERLSIEVDSKLLRYMHVEFPREGQKPDFWYSADVREFRGRTVTLRYKSHDAAALDRLQLGDKEIIPANAYDTPNRPRFHFSPRLGWMNDINGSYYQDGRYHIFYQFNPATTTKGAGFDMHWGHSVSKDLVHWEEWPVALFPNAEGQCYSGTAVIMQRAIPGLTDGISLPSPALFFAATTPFSQHIATTSDGGRTWKRFAGNPVVPNMGSGDRDPKVIWHEASQHFVMVLYVGGPDTYRILRSKDLIKWEQTSVLPNWFECPEFVPMKSAITGEDLMLLYGCYRTPGGAKEPFNSNSAYQLGRFDGQTFRPVTKHRNAHQGPNFYGALTFVNAPNDRHVMMGWARGSRFPGEPFNQCASLPLEMRMKAINGENTLCFEPAEEINALRGKPAVALSNVTVAEASSALQKLTSDAVVDVVLRFRPEATDSANINLNIRSISLSYNPATHLLKRGNTSVEIHPGNSVSARFLIDRGIVESFWNQGEAAFSISSLHTDKGPAFAIEGRAVIEELTIYPMASIWTQSPVLGHQTQSIEGWTVHVSERLLREEQSKTTRALELLRGQLQEIVRVVPAPAVATLREVPLWFSPEYAGVTPRAEYHPGAGWLRDNGRDPAMAKGVEFTDIRNFEAESVRMPNFTLHELAHAYHDKVLPGGFGNSEIKLAYERAKNSNSYDKVERWFGNGRSNTFERAYAMTSPQEYFAESTEAYFSRNDFFPFNRAELQQHDPGMANLLGRVWGVTSQSSNLQAPNTKETSSSKLQ